MIKIVIAGSREYNNYDEAKEYINNCVKEITESSIMFLSGGCRGADMLGERYADENGYMIMRINPEWNKYGKAAGVVRNKKMAEEADLVICFWDGKSKGTKAMIEYTKKLNKKIIVKLITI